MTFVQAMILAVLQGVSELFPISSLGHTILVPALLHWNNIKRADPNFLGFVVVLHFGTAIALIVFYWRDWVAIVKALLASIVRGKLSDDRNERIGWLLVVGTVPVGLLGLLFQEKVQALFGAVAPAAIFLMLNGLLMFFGEYLRNRQLAPLALRQRPFDYGFAGSANPAQDDTGRYKQLEQIGWLQSVFVGLGQSLALLPGISRSGSSIVAGLLIDLTHADAAKYSFLLATPVIFAAALLKIPELFAPSAGGIAIEAVVGGVVSGICAFFSVAFLTKYFQSNDLRPFGWYCLMFGAICLALAVKGVIA
ncbi:MAG: undecaprenyl-diphosphate phosphatase [Candidatus Eremiobacteraeota bacterium]|nr:undecaprenyl-diphosphate phosphatase [Candidatus Eremiobacteraeota bacterium]